MSEIEAHWLDDPDWTIDYDDDSQVGRNCLNAVLVVILAVACVVSYNFSHIEPPQPTTITPPLYGQINYAPGNYHEAGITIESGMICTIGGRP